MKCSPSHHNKESEAIEARKLEATQEHGPCEFGEVKATQCQCGRGWYANYIVVRYKA